MYNPSSFLRDIVMYTSLGGFSSSSNRFYEAPVETGASTTLDIDCPQGNFSIDPDVAYYGLSNNFLLTI